jgi:hypothetical protein
MLTSLGVDDRHLYGSPADKLEPLDIFGGKSARHAMQTLGCEWGRDCIDTNFWVRAWEAVLDAECDTDHVIVADDVRFETEAEAIEKRGGLLLCVVRDRDDFNRIPRHASEDFAALPYNHVIVNAGSLFGLERALECRIENARPTWRAAAE